MILNDTILLAANTARTNAYAQALANSNLKIKAAILFEGTKTIKAGQATNLSGLSQHETSVFLPDLSQPLQDSINAICDEIIEVKADSVNHEKVLEALKVTSAKLFIYSGYGSQIVGENILKLCPQLLHLHSGWLPEFRGSTTLYYHLLESDYCGVSAILLDKGIDTGPIIARKNYPKPTEGINIDYLYDCAIRADLLVEVLTYYHANGTLPFEQYQSSDEGNTYYIIHPVLKHLAIISNT